MAAITEITTTTKDSSLQSIIPNIINEGGNSNTDLIDKTTDPIWLNNSGNSINNKEDMEWFINDSVKNLVIDTGEKLTDDKNKTADKSEYYANMKDYRPPYTYEDFNRDCKELAKDCIIGVINLLRLPVDIMEAITKNKNNSQNDSY